MELLKKENRENLLKILTQEGVLYEWAGKHGIHLEYEEVKFVLEERVEIDNKEDILQQ